MTGLFRNVVIIMIRAFSMVLTTAGMLALALGLKVSPRELYVHYRLLAAQNTEPCTDRQTDVQGPCSDE